jgi:uncharacterized protein DUF222/HNH endonuclease
MIASLQRTGEIRRELDTMAAAWLRLVAEYDRSDDWRARGRAADHRRDRRRRRGRDRRGPPSATTRAHVAHARRHAALVLEAAVNAQVEREFLAGDGRTPAQRRADAVTELFGASLDTGRVGNRRAVRPHVTVVVGLDQLRGVPPDLDELVRTGRPDGGLSAATLERITCDCDVSRVITAGRSEILDAGRATRRISPALWRALVVRDGGCRLPGCGAGPEHCEAHHIVHWARGGVTDLDNLEPRCRHHHREVHIHNRYRHTDAQPRAA